MIEIKVSLSTIRLSTYSLQTEREKKKDLCGIRFNIKISGKLLYCYETKLRTL